MDKRYCDVHRLGQVVEDLQEAEPIIRGGNMLSFDMSAIRSPDAPGNANASPNGLYGEQARSEEHTSELQSLMRISYAVFFLKKNINTQKSTDSSKIQYIHIQTTRRTKS